MILNFKKGSQILGKKIADLDTSEPTQAASLQQASQPAALQPTPVLATSASAAEPEAPQLGASAPSEDWRDLLVRLISTAPEDVAQKLVGCLDKEVITKALEKKNDPYLKVALMLLTKIMIRIGFCFIKGGTGKSTLASSAVLYLNAAVAAAGLIDTAPVPVASLMLAAGTQPGVYAGREDVPVAVTRTPESLDAAIRALEKMKVSIAVVDLPPMPKTPRLDVAVVVADGPGLEFLPEFKADAAHVVLAANMVDKLDGRYKNLANSAVALPYSPAVAKAYAKLTPPILPHHPKAASLGRWKKSFLALMNKVAEHVKK